MEIKSEYWYYRLGGRFLYKLQYENNSYYATSNRELDKIGLKAITEGARDYMLQRLEDHSSVSYFTVLSQLFGLKKVNIDDVISGQCKIKSFNQ